MSSIKVTIAGNVQDRFSWSDGITEAFGFGSPHAALDDYMARHGYAKLGMAGSSLATGLQHAPDATPRPSHGIAGEH